MQVKEIRDSDSVCIYELDYGKTKVVHRSVFQPLVTDFRELPFQAVVAQLAGTGGVFYTFIGSVTFFLTAVCSLTTSSHRCDSVPVVI